MSVAAKRNRNNTGAYPSRQISVSMGTTVLMLIVYRRIMFRAGRPLKRFRQTSPHCWLKFTRNKEHVNGIVDMRVAYRRIPFCLPIWLTSYLHMKSISHALQLRNVIEHSCFCDALLLVWNGIILISRILQYIRDTDSRMPNMVLVSKNLLHIYLSVWKMGFKAGQRLWNLFDVDELFAVDLLKRFQYFI